MTAIQDDSEQTQLGLNLLLQPCFVRGMEASRGREGGGGGFLLRGFLCFIFLKTSRIKGVSFETSNMNVHRRGDIYIYIWLLYSLVGTGCIVFFFSAQQFILSRRVYSESFLLLHEKTPQLISRISIQTLQCQASTTPPGASSKPPSPSPPPPNTTPRH